jgi:hypothetical protein
MPEVLLRILIGRIEEAKPTPFPGRQRCPQPLEAIAALHRHARPVRAIALSERLLQGMRLRTLLLDEQRPILCAQFARGDER